MAAVTKYVNTDTGSDSNDGESGTPWASISYAINQTSSNTGNDVTINCSGTAADTVARIDMNGYLADSLTINGEAFTGAQYLTGIYRLELTDIATAAFFNRSNAVPITINNFQIKVTHTTVGSSIYQESGLSGAANIVINNAYFWIVNNFADMGDGIKFGSAATGRIFNNVIMRLTGTVGIGNRAYESGSGTSIGLFNCIAHGAWDTGIYRINMYNCASIGSTGDSYSVLGTTVVTCAGDRGTFDNVTNVTDWTTEFVDHVNGDYTIDAASTVLLDGGTNVSATNGGVSTDIVGSSRGAAWDIGSFEYSPPFVMDTVPPTVAREQAGVIIGASAGGFGATQGSGGVEYNNVAVTVTSWSDTSITVTMPASLPMQHTATGYSFKVTESSGLLYSNTAAVPFTPQTGYSYVNLVSPVTTDGTMLFNSTGDLPATGDQSVYQTSTNPDSVGFEIGADGEWILSSTPTGTQTVNWYVIQSDGTLSNTAQGVFDITPSVEPLAVVLSSPVTMTGALVTDETGISASLSSSTTISANLTTLWSVKAENEVGWAVQSKETDGWS